MNAYFKPGWVRTWVSSDRPSSDLHTHHSDVNGARLSSSIVMNSVRVFSGNILISCIRVDFRNCDIQQYQSANRKKVMKRFLRNCAFHRLLCSWRNICAKWRLKENYFIIQACSCFTSVMSKVTVFFLIRGELSWTNLGVSWIFYLRWWHHCKISTLPPKPHHQLHTKKHEDVTHSYRRLWSPCVLCLHVSVFIMQCFII